MTKLERQLEEARQALTKARAEAEEAHKAGAGATLQVMRADWDCNSELRL